MIQEAMFGAGCFWGVEALFAKVPGVVDTQVGYAGGTVENPSYKEVCTDKTGHAEVVWLRFDNEKVSYEQLLDIFFANHNPTTINRQGPDIGAQYRSVIFYYSEDQYKLATHKIQQLTDEKHYSQKIVTAISPAPTFYRAEEYHQKYLEKKGQDHCGI